MNTMNDQLLRHASYTGSIEVSADDECLHGRILHIDDLITYEGETVAQLRAEFEAAVKRYVDHCAKIGKQPNRPYTGSFNVRLGHDRHRWLVEVSAGQGRKLNELVCDAVDALRASTTMSKQTGCKVADSTAIAAMLGDGLVIMTGAVGGSWSQLQHLALDALRPSQTFATTSPATEHVRYHRLAS